MTNKLNQCTVSIITPCYNAEKYIAETIQSVVKNTVFQDVNVRLEYIVCDGGSTDNTGAIVNDIFSQVNRENINLAFFSEPDGGMYEALAKGLSRATGDVCAYINAGDFYSPTAFEIVLEIFRNPSVRWITGLRVQYNERSHLVYAELPFKYRKGLCESGFYGKFFPFIQQESTFWLGTLTSQLDLTKLAQFKYAGDYFIWNTFFNTEQLYIVEAWLGGFKSHQNQLSENMVGYYAEMDRIARKPWLKDYCIAYIDKMIWDASNRKKKLFNTDSMFTFDFKLQKYSLHVDRRLSKLLAMCCVWRIR